MARQQTMALYDAVTSQDRGSGALDRQATRALNNRRSVTLALERARDRLPKDCSGQPYQHFGLLAPVRNVRTLGSDAAFYVRFIQEGALVVFAVLVAQFPAIASNMGGTVASNWTEEYQPFVDAGMLSGTDPLVDYWEVGWPNCGTLGVGAGLTWGRWGGGGELAGATRLSFTHVISDSLAMLFVVLFFVRLQRLMLRDGYIFGTGYVFAQSAVQSAVGLTASGVELALAVPGVLGAGTKTLAANIGAGEAYGAIEGSVVKSAEIAVKGAEIAVKTSAKAAKLSAGNMKKAMMRTGKFFAKVVPKSIKRRSKGWSKSILKSLPPLPDLWDKSSASSAVRVDMAAAACTVVLWGYTSDEWTRARPEQLSLAKRISSLMGFSHAHEEVERVSVNWHCALQEASLKISSPPKQSSSKWGAVPSATASVTASATPKAAPATKLAIDAIEQVSASTVNDVESIAVVVHNPASPPASPPETESPSKLPTFSTPRRQIPKVSFGDAVKRISAGDAEGSELPAVASPPPPEIFSPAMRRLKSVLGKTRSTGEEVPAEVLRMLADAAGEAPYVINQAKDVYDLTHAWEELTECTVAKCRANAKALPGGSSRVLWGSSRKNEAGSGRVRSRKAETAKEAKAREEAVEEVARLSEQLRGLQTKVNRLQKETVRIPLAFVSFQSSRAAQAAFGCADELKRKFGVNIGAAPRPTDVVWEHLHVDPTKAHWRVAYIVLVSLIMAPLIALTIIIATAFAQMCLIWVPANMLISGWAPLEKLIGGLHWCWGVAMFMLAYAVLNQLVSLTLAQSEAGWCPTYLRPLSIKDWYHSMSSGQMHFITIVSLVECLALLVGVGLLHDQLSISRYLCDTTCLCWWLNPHYRALGNWYDFGAGLAFNTLVNSFIGDTLFSSFAAKIIGRTLDRYFAKDEPTQYLMDEKCRSKDAAYLPWRIVHLVKAWSFAIILMPVVPFAVMPLLVYHILSFVIDRYNMLCALEPLPPSSGLCMRFVLTFLPPLIVPLHYIIGFIGFRHAVICGDRDESGNYRGCVRDERPEGDGMPELITYTVIGGVLVVYLFVEIFVFQKRQAVKLGLMTPYQVLMAGFMNDRGFGYASAAEPYRFVDVTLADVDLDREHMEEMYTAEVLLRRVEHHSSSRGHHRGTLQPSLSQKKMRVTVANSNVTEIDDGTSLPERSTFSNFSFGGGSQRDGSKRSRFSTFSRKDAKAAKGGNSEPTSPGSLASEREGSEREGSSVCSMSDDEASQTAARLASVRESRSEVTDVEAPAATEDEKPSVERSSSEGVVTVAVETAT